MFCTFKMQHPKTSIFCIIIITLFLFFSFAAAAEDKEALTVKIGPPIKYESETGEKFLVRYGSLSDGTLHFVKVKLPDGKKYTLHQAISGSGARYTDDREIVWWEHQGTVRVDVRGTDGEWKTKYSELKMVNDE